MTDDQPMRKYAQISDCKRYRYLLTRTWNDNRDALPFVMLNPSTADAEIDDPTIRRCISFAEREGAGGIMVANLYAYRATDPTSLWAREDPYGPANDHALMQVASFAAAAGIPIVCAWGVHGGRNNRPIVMMQQAGARLVCLGRTKDGHPRHPLYVKGTQPLEPYP
jgi:hypothetical protein